MAGAYEGTWGLCSGRNRDGEGALHGHDLVLEIKILAFKLNDNLSQIFFQLPVRYFLFEKPAKKFVIKRFW